MNEMQFSPEAEDMHAGAMDYEAVRALMAELNAMDAREAMEEARGNDGVSREFHEWLEMHEAMP